MVQKLGRTKKVIKSGKIREKDDIITDEEKRIDFIVNKTKISLEMTPGQRGLEVRQWKAS